MRQRVRRDRQHRLAPASRASARRAPLPRGGRRLDRRVGCVGAGTAHPSGSGFTASSRPRPCRAHGRRRLDRRGSTNGRREHTAAMPVWDAYTGAHSGHRLDQHLLDSLRLCRVGRRRLDRLVGSEQLRRFASQLAVDQWRARYAFAALRADGSIVSWGRRGYDPPPASPSGTGFTMAASTIGALALKPPTARSSRGVHSNGGPAHHCHRPHAI